MVKSHIGKNIRALRESKGWRQVDLAAAIDVSHITVSLWENDKVKPQGDTLDALCNALDCTEADLLGISDGFYQRSTGISAIKPMPSSTYAPVVGNIAAGDPREAIEMTDEVHWCPPELRERYPDGFFLRIVGDSMYKLLPDGCYAYIVPEEPVSGEIFAVKVNGDDATVKRLKFLDGVIVLEPESTNPEHKRRIIDSNDPDAPYFRCLGRVTWYDYEVASV